MQCSEFREIVGANPYITDPVVVAHRESCADCSKYASDMELIDTKLRHALNVRSPAAAPLIATLPQRNTATRWLALAASVLLVVCIGTFFWWRAVPEGLIVEVVKHADNERDVMVATDKRVKPERLLKTLAKAGAWMDPQSPVSIARTCKIRGVVAPHLIMQTSAGPVAVLVMPQQKLRATRSFEELGYRGAIMPTGHGSIAFVAANRDAVKEATAITRSSFEWRGAIEATAPVM